MRFRGCLVLLSLLLSSDIKGFQVLELGDAQRPYRLALEFDSGKNIFGVGDPIIVSAKISNAAGFTLECPSPRDQMIFSKVELFAASSEVVNSLPHWISVPIDGRHWRGRADVSSPMPACSILPGEVYRAGSIRLSDVFRVNRKGQYRVIYSRVFPNPMNRSEILRVRSQELFTIE